MSDERKRNDDRAANRASAASVAVPKRGVSKDFSEPKASVVDGEADAVQP
jgi:hypothetical protein